VRWQTSVVLAALLVAAGSASGITASGVTGPVVASQILAAFVLVVLYGVLDQVMALTPPRSGELL